MKATENLFRHYDPNDTLEEPLECDYLKVTISSKCLLLRSGLKHQYEKTLLSKNISYHRRKE